MNYKLIKNTDWKEVEINGEMKEIPSDWEVDKIENFFNCSMGQTILNKDVSLILKNGFIPVFSATEEDKHFGYIESSKVRNILNKNDIVIPARGNSIGFSKLIKEPSTSTQTTIQLKSLDKINSNIVYYLFKKNKESFFPVNPGTIPQLTVLEVNNLEIPYPNKQQSAIASILSEQESVIENIEQLIEKYEQRFQYLSDELLSGKLRVKEVDGEVVLYKNPDDNWKEVEINGEIKEIPSDWENSTPKMFNFNIKTGKKDANAAKTNGQYPFFTCSSNEIFKIDSYNFDTEALLISGNGSTLGEVRYYNGKFDAYQRTYVIDNIPNIFYYNFYFKKYFRDSLNIIGGSIPFIKLGHIEDFDILIPPNNESQLIVKILSNQESLMLEQKELLKQEKQKFNWLLDNLLSGKYLIKE